jgi:hypothetical protein
MEFRADDILGVQPPRKARALPYGPSHSVVASLLRSPTASVALVSARIARVHIMRGVFRCANTIGTARDFL